MNLILTHPNADFDAVAALLAAHRLYPDAVPVLPDRVNRNVEHFLALYRNGVTFVNQSDLRVHDVKQVILVDTQRLPQMRGLKPNTPTIIIDHHQPFTQPGSDPQTTLTSEPVGAVTTLLVERIRERGLVLTSMEATLLALGIYEDTGSLSYGTTTPRDLHAAAWLLEHNAAMDTVRRFLTLPLTDEQQQLFEKLIAGVESRAVQGHTVIVSAARVPAYVHEISTVVHRLRDILESSALFVVVEMPDNLLLVCRSTSDALDVGEIARLFGGGGHNRAAAATLYDRSLSDVVTSLWREVEQRMHPVTRVSDLMSYGAQTVRTDQRVSQVAQQLRRIGHEGFPVVDDSGRVTGLLTRRDADRAMEHGLGSLTVREVMASGPVAVRPDDSVLLLEQRMVESGWGQIPVVDSSNRLIGIVTRTDLIKHWARTHPAQPALPQSVFTTQQMAHVLGHPTARLIALTAWHAQQQRVNLYLVGGVVRDLLLDRSNLDIDFVVEGSAIELAQRLQQGYGGVIHSFQPFGTAKWILDAGTATALDATTDQLPHHIDFATTRNEFYEHPTALPTVYRSSIKLDLQRRDFTINSLAIQLSPASATGHILDFYGGMNDLRDGLIRVLHSLSFVDDPTRILRAARFELRLGFAIEARTAELIETALPMLRRITGRRILNELDLLLREQRPEHALFSLQGRGVLEAIHPDFRVDQDTAARFELARTQRPPWPFELPDAPLNCWHALAAGTPLAALSGLLDRLMMGRRIATTLLETARLVQEPSDLDAVGTQASRVVRLLEPVTKTSLWAAWLFTPSIRVQERIATYMLTWRHIQPVTTGYTLRELGVPPGPCYSAILWRLRAAWLDGEVASASDEARLLPLVIAQETAGDST